MSNATTPTPGGTSQKPDNDLELLLAALIRVSNAQAGTEAGPDQRLLDAEGLMLKFVGHASSAVALSRGTNLPELGIGFFDPGSVNGLVRAAVETFLVFHDVFVSPTSPAEADARFLAWWLGGLIDRQRFPLHSPAGKKLLEHEAAEIEVLKRRLETNSAFANLPAVQRKQILRGRWRAGRDGRDTSWKDLAMNAGFNEESASGLYHFLCGFAHSNWISVLQLRQARTADDQRQLMAGSLSYLAGVMAHMIRAVCRVFPKAQEHFAKDDQAQELVATWAYVISTQKRPDIEWSRLGLGDHG
jgi:hypothetical protein